MNERPANSLAWESLEQDDRFTGWQGWPGAVLLNDEIEYYCTVPPPERRLLDPFDKRLLKPARYQLRLGGQARIDGQTISVTETQPLLIQAHQVAIVSTLEHLNIPRFLIGRWNLRVDMVYRGLLWVGALQVDPGWVGYLPCPLYNMSDKPVEIQYGDPVFTIDFVRTTPFIKDKSKPYKRDDEPNQPVATYDRSRLRSGPYETLARQDQLAVDLAGLRRHVEGAMAVMFTAMAALVTALGIMAAWPTATSRTPQAASTITLVVAIFALVLALAAFGRSFHQQSASDLIENGPFRGRS